MDSAINMVCVVASVQDDKLMGRMINLLQDQFKNMFQGVGHTLKVVGKYYLNALMRGPLCINVRSMICSTPLPLVCLFIRK